LAIDGFVQDVSGVSIIPPSSAMFVGRNGSTVADILSEVEWNNGTVEGLFNSTVAAVQDDLASSDSKIDAATNGSTSLVSLICQEGCNSTYIPQVQTTGSYIGVLPAK
jgi:hypothetical protein